MNTHTHRPSKGALTTPQKPIVQAALKAKQFSSSRELFGHVLERFDKAGVTPPEEKKLHSYFQTYTKNQKRAAVNSTAFEFKRKIEQEFSLVARVRAAIELDALTEGTNLRASFDRGAHDQNMVMYYFGGSSLWHVCCARACSFTFF